MIPPALVALVDEAAYRVHYQKTLCQQTVLTFDGLVVHFPKWQFDHAFFESANRRKGDKSVFSLERAKRMDWIRPALADPTARLFEGWDKKKGTYTRDRRTCVVCGNYVVVITVRGGNKGASFVTAFPAESPTLRRITTGPHW